MTDAQKEVINFLAEKKYGTKQELKNLLQNRYYRSNDKHFAQRVLNRLLETGTIKTEAQGIYVLSSKTLAHMNPIQLELF